MMKGQYLMIYLSIDWEKKGFSYISLFWLSAARPYTRLVFIQNYHFIYFYQGSNPFRFGAFLKLGFIPAIFKEQG